MRVLNYLILGYGSYQLMRLSMSMVAPALKEELHFSNTDIGLIFSAFTLVYAFSRIICGIFSDRMDPRFFLFVGLMGSCLCNAIFSLSDVLGNFILFWGLNAFFQSMGAPACARILKHTIEKKKYGTYWALWSTNTPIGGAIFYLFSGYAMSHYGWRISTFMSVGFCLVMGLLFYKGMNRFQFDFQYAGKKDVDKSEVTQFLTVSYFREIFSNKRFLKVCMASFCLYSIRVGLFTWFPQILKEVKGAETSKAGIYAAIFEIGSLAGGLLAGWLSDKHFNSNRGKVGAFYMFATAVVIALLWILPIENSFLYMTVVVLFGFLAFGPQVLAGVSAMDNASHKTVGIATGSISLFGYLGATFTSFILGLISDCWGWGWGFVLTFGLAAAGGWFFLQSDEKKGSGKTALQGA